MTCNPFFFNNSKTAFLFTHSKRANASSNNIYLIESKWDNLLENKENKIGLDKKQVLRHKIFSWYYKHPDWEKLRETLQSDFRREFPNKKIAPPGSLLARNLKFVLGQLQERSKRFDFKSEELKNVLLFFHSSNSKEIKEIIPTRKDIHFEIININYSQYKNDFENTFIILN